MCISADEQCEAKDGKIVCIVNGDELEDWL
ncbi:hypothetical protein AVEN_37108-1, partial [Araneus ventricosus]